MKKLLAIGDSFTYGDELTNPQTDSWPQLLGKMIGYEVTNLGHPGSSNTRMVRLTVEHANDYDIVIVAWSHWARFELADEHGYYDSWPGFDTSIPDEWAPWRKTAIEYFNRHHSDEYLYQQYLLDVVLVQNFLKQNSKNYLMADSFGNNLFGPNKRSQPSQKLLSQIKKEFFLGWPTETMMHWTTDCPRGPKGHFLEQGHQRVAEKFNEHIRRISWVS